MIHNARTAAVPQSSSQQPQQQQKGGVYNPNGQPAPPALPGIDREAYYSQQREAASDLMGVMGVDGKLYRSDVTAKTKRAR
jgi:hypothetical protein